MENYNFYATYIYTMIFSFLYKLGWKYSKQIILITFSVSTYFLDQEEYLALVL